jgi:uncharacterized protein (DUF433 family)
MADADIVLALSAEHIVKLTGLTMRQLAYWDRTGFFQPEHAAENRRSPNSRVYSFSDAVGLRTISTLMNRYNVSHHQLKKVARELSISSTKFWSEMKLWVLKGRVYFQEPETGSPRDVLGAQYAILGVIDEIRCVEQGIEALKARDSSAYGQFEKHKNISQNRLVIAGTRIPVQTILEYLEDGYQAAEIVRRFPLLTHADVEAVAKSGKQALAA